jgi:hypothetical protein
MKKSLNLIKFIFGIIFVMALCFFVQSYLFFNCNAAAGKGESNYFSTLSRMQFSAVEPAQITLVGSSITGRLPGREAGNVDIANLGSDGGSSLDGLRLISMQKIPTTKWVVIEANTLFVGVGYKDPPIIKGAQGFWFETGVCLPLLGASARPSSMLYARLQGRKKLINGDSFLVTPSNISLLEDDFSKNFTKDEKKRFLDYVEIIDKLIKLDVKVIIAHYPSASRSERESYLIRKTVDKLTKRFHVIYVDLEKQIPGASLKFSDSVHLSSESAARILNTIKVFCQNTKFQ